ncbi:MAG TPA: RES family NAD+ phosphorylase [Thermoanaerobaculia bacterium]|nr:RES family NAD+ phosphorylase [Thermoanaerobaculia bacterium]
MTLPRIRLIRQNDTHRLIPSKYSESVLAEIADNDAHLQDIFDLDNATNDRLLAENNLALGIGIHELVFGVPYFRIVNAAFCHPHPLGSRFNGPDRGAWYATFELETAQEEVAFHKWIELAEAGWTEEEEATYDDYLADFSAELHDIRRDKRFAAALASDSYVASQALAQKLLDAGSLGIVYPSVRRRNGTCLACFRPALVMNVRKGSTCKFRWEGRPKPSVSIVR